MSLEQLMEWKLAEETEVLEENLSQFHFIHYKSHMTWPDLGSNPWYRGGKPVTNRPSYGIAKRYVAKHCAEYRTEKVGCNCTSTAPHVFMAWCLILVN
jgi:hypothetical protein